MLFCLLVQQHNRGLHDSVAVDQETTETDEGIGESETDIASNTDADTSCTSFISSFCQQPLNVASFLLTHEHVQQHSSQCDNSVASYTCEANPVLSSEMTANDNKAQQNPTDISTEHQNCATDNTDAENLLESQNCESCDTVNSASVPVDNQTDSIDVELLEDSGSSQTYDVLKPLSPNDDDSALSEDSGSSQTLSVTQSLSLNDDDQGSLTDVTETAHSDDSGSSRTVEVGDDVPQLLDDEEEVVEADSSLQAESQITADQPVPLQSSEMNSGSTAWNSEEVIDSAKDVTVTKESGENWDDDLSVDLRTDEEVHCKYNYCVVQKSPFPLGYERSKISLICVIGVFSVESYQ